MWSQSSYLYSAVQAAGMVTSQARSSVPYGEINCKSTTFLFETCSSTRRLSKLKTLKVSHYMEFTGYPPM